MASGQMQAPADARLGHRQQALWLTGAITAIAPRPEAIMRIIGVLLVVWLIVGMLAGLQRHYYNGAVSCAHAGTVAATIAAGPLNYVGANPKVHCAVPQPSS
jgi:hypothetical protein